MPYKPASYRPYPPQPRLRRRDTKRGTAPERGYDGDWAKLRNYYIAKHPVCQHPGCTQAGQIVDHIIPVRDCPERRLDHTNLQTLCRVHHARKTEADKCRAIG